MFGKIITIYWINFVRRKMEENSPSKQIPNNERQDYFEAALVSLTMSLSINCKCIEQISIFQSFSWCSPRAVQINSIYRRFTTCCGQQNYFP